MDEKKSEKLESENEEEMSKKKCCHGEGDCHEKGEGKCHEGKHHGEIHEKIKRLEKELEEKNKEIERCDKLIDDYKAKANSYLSTASYYKNQAETNKQDFDRLKERNKNIEKDAVTKANSVAVKKILPLIDDFDHAMMALSPDVMRGFIMIYSSLVDTVKSFGVVEISAKNEKLDPEKHNCIETEETDDESLDGIISNVYQKGYYFAETGEVVRPSNVAVYKFTPN